MKLTTQITKGEKFWIAEVPELGVVTQGATPQEAKSNLKEALELYLDTIAEYAIEHGEVEIINGKIVQKKYA